MAQQGGQWPEAADWITEPPPPPTRLETFRARNPEIVIGPGSGCFEADYRLPDGRRAYKARYELPALLDDLEEELGQ